MVLDQIFGHLESVDSDLSYIHNSTEALNEMSMDLDDYKFDFDSLSDNLGGWIDTSADDDCKVSSNDFNDTLKSEPMDFKDLNITEAVRYDCMWSSNPTNNSISQPIISENNLLDDFIKFMDANASHFELDLDIKEESTTSPEPKAEPASCDPLACDRLQERQSEVRMYTSLDHSYVSKSIPYDDQHPSYPITPPESSEDEESPCSSRTSLTPPKIVNVQSISSQSLLKKVRSRSGEAKFCVKVKLSSDPSRSLLKQQKFRLLKSQHQLKQSSLSTSTSSSSTSSPDSRKCSASRLSSSKSLLQTSIRRRKEESLRIKHDEAREIHNHMERQRRNELKVAFDELKACIPDIANSEKVSKQMILDTALQNCKLLKSRETTLKVKREKLKKSNADLLRKLNALQQSRNSSSSMSRCHTSTPSSPIK